MSADKTAAIIEELLHLGGQALDRALGSRHAIKHHAHEALSDVADALNLVTHNDLDDAIAMIVKARTVQGEHSARLDVIEQKLGLAKPSKKVTTKKASLRSVKHNKRKTPR